MKLIVRMYFTLLEFLGNYAKLTIKTSTGESKIISVKKVPPVGIEPGPLMIHSDAFLTELT